MKNISVIRIDEALGRRLLSEICVRRSICTAMRIAGIG